MLSTCNNISSILRTLSILINIKIFYSFWHNSFLFSHLNRHNFHLSYVHFLDLYGLHWILQYPSPQACHSAYFCSFDPLTFGLPLNLYLTLNHFNSLIRCGTLWGSMISCPTHSQTWKPILIISSIRKSSR